MTHFRTTSQDGPAADLPDAEKTVSSALLSFPVRSYDCGPAGLVTLSSLANYLQEAAGHHARLLGVSMERLMEDRLAWVLRRMRVEVERLPARGDEVTVETWPVRFGRLVAERHFLVRDERGSVLARAASEWVIVDLDKRKVARVPDFVRRLRPLSERLCCELPDRALGLLEKQIDLDGALHAATDFRALRSSLDVVGHVNNSQYVRWIVDALPAAWWQDWTPSGFEIHYLAECSLGETLQVESWPVAADAASFRVLHRVSTSGGADREESFQALGKRTLAVTQWQRRE